MKGIYIDNRYWDIVGANATAVFVYAVIAYATKKGGYNGGQERLAEVCHISRQSLIPILKKLEENGVIETHFENGIKIYKTTPQQCKETLQDDVKELDEQCKETLQDDVKELDEQCKETLQDDVKELDDTPYINHNKRGKKEESPKNEGDFISFAAVVMEDFKKWFEYVKGVPFSNNSDTLTECREIAGQVSQLMRAQNLNADNVDEFRAFFRKWIKAAYEVCDRWQKDNFSLITLKRQFNQLTAKINGQSLNTDELAAALADIERAQSIIAQNRQGGNA